MESTPRSFGCGPRRLGRSSNAFDILFSNALDCAGKIVVVEKSSESVARDLVRYSLLLLLVVSVAILISLLFS